MASRCCFVPDRRAEGLLMCTCGQTWGAAVHHRQRRLALHPPTPRAGEGTPSPLPVELTLLTQIGIMEP